MARWLQPRFICFHPFFVWRCSSTSSNSVSTSPSANRSCGFPQPALGRVSHHGIHQRPRRQLARDAQHLLESPEQPGFARVSLISGSETRRGAPQTRTPSLLGSCVVRRALIGMMSPSDFPRGSSVLTEEGARLAREGSPMWASVLRASTSQLPFIVSVATGVSRQLPRQNLPL
jgi:hypothetical protein